MVWPPRSVWAHDDHIKVWLLGRTEQVKYPLEPFHCHRPTKPSSSTFLIRFFMGFKKRFISYMSTDCNLLDNEHCRAVSQVSSIASSSRDPQLCDQMKGSLIKKQVIINSKRGRVMRVALPKRTKGVLGKPSKKRRIFAPEIQYMIY